MYLEGLGSPKEEEKAAQWYTKEAEKNYAPAQNKLGYLYLTGQGIPKDECKARTLFYKAAAQKNENALNAIGDAFKEGSFVQKDSVISYFYYSLAASLGSSVAGEKRDELSKNLTNAQLSEGKKRMADWKWDSSLPQNITSCVSQ